MNTVYVVSGWMRSGTSMMMHALQQGGMSVTSSDAREQFGQRHSDAQYNVNPGGMFELQPDVLEQTFPQDYTDKVVKLVVPWLCFLKPEPQTRYKVLFMLRDSEEIRQDYEAAFDKRVTRPTIDGQVATSLAMLQARSDVHVLIVPYRSVVFYPQYWMQQIRYAGWPIAPTHAASVVNPDLYTFKRELLAQGL